MELETGPKLTAVLVLYAVITFLMLSGLHVKCN